MNQINHQTNQTNQTSQMNQTNGPRWYALRTRSRHEKLVWDRLAAERPHLRGLEPAFGPSRPGDVRHSQADISKAKRLLGYAPPTLWRKDWTLPFRST